MKSRCQLPALSCSASAADHCLLCIKWPVLSGNALICMVWKLLLEKGRKENSQTNMMVVEQALGGFLTILVGKSKKKKRNYHCAMCKILTMRMAPVWVFIFRAEALRHQVSLYLLKKDTFYFFISFKMWVFLSLWNLSHFLTCKCERRQGRKSISGICSSINYFLWLKQYSLMSWVEHPPLLECYLLPPAAALSSESSWHQWLLSAPMLPAANRGFSFQTQALFVSFSFWCTDTSCHCYPEASMGDGA